MSTLFLLYPEWQGSGTAPAVQQGALAIARELFPETHFMIVDSPDEERLGLERDVMGLASIAPRFSDTLARIKRAAPETIVTIGGTCGVEAAPIAYLNQRYDGDLAVVWFDAHADMNTPESSPSGNFHGMVLRTLLGNGPDAYVRELQPPLRPEQVFLAGTRDLDPPEREFVARAAISLMPPEEFNKPERLIRDIQARRFRHVYLHLDLDVLDPTDFPDTLIPTPRGPSVARVQAMLEALAGAFVVAGASIVEYVHRSDASLRIIDDLLAANGVKLTR